MTLDPGSGPGAGVEIRAFSALDPPTGDQREAPLLREETICLNERPSWWMPAHHHCALDHELRKYPGITCIDYWWLFHRQEGRCAVCRRPPGKWRFACDRNHDTGEIEGLIHHRCNRPIDKNTRRYILNPPGRGLGIMADPGAVAKAEKRKAKPRPRKTTKPQPSDQPTDYAAKVAAALAASAQDSKER